MKKHGGRKKIQQISTLKTFKVDFQMGDFMYERAKHCALYVAVEPNSYYISGTCVAAVGRFSNFYSLHSDIHRFLNQGCALGSKGGDGWQLMQIGKYGNKEMLEIFTIESIIYSDKEFLDKAKAKSWFRK